MKFNLERAKIESVFIRIYASLVLGILLESCAWAHFQPGLQGGEMSVMELHCVTLGFKLVFQRLKYAL